MKLSSYWVSWRNENKEQKAAFEFENLLLTATGCYLRNLTSPRPPCRLTMAPWTTHGLSVLIDDCCTMAAANPPARCPPLLAPNSSGCEKRRHLMTNGGSARRRCSRISLISEATTNFQPGVKDFPHAFLTSPYHLGVSRLNFVIVHKLSCFRGLVTLTGQSHVHPHHPAPSIPFSSCCHALWFYRQSSDRLVIRQMSCRSGGLHHQMAQTEG